MNYYHILFTWFFIFLYLTAFCQKKEFNKAMDEGENSRGYILISYKTPQSVEEVKKLCNSYGYSLLTWRSGSAIKFGDNVEGPLEFYIMKKENFNQLVKDCNEFGITCDFKNLNGTIDRVKAAHAAEKIKLEKELAEQKRVDDLAATHIPTFIIEPEWENFKIEYTKKDIQFVTWQGKTGVVFKGTKKWIIPPIYKRVQNYNERYFFTSNSPLDNPLIFDRNYNQIKMESSQGSQ